MIDRESFDKQVKARFADVQHGEGAWNAFVDCVERHARAEIEEAFDQAVNAPNATPESVHAAFDQAVTIQIEALQNVFAPFGDAGDDLKQRATAAIITASEKRVGELVSSATMEARDGRN